MTFKLSLVIAELALLLPQAASSSVEVCSGTLVLARNSRVCVKAAHAVHTYSVAPRCQVTIDELPAVFDDLESGQVVTVMAPAGPNHSVQKIEAFSTPISRVFPGMVPRRVRR